MDNLLSAIIMIYLVIGLSIFGGDKIVKKIESQYKHLVSSHAQETETDMLGLDASVYSSSKYDRSYYVAPGGLYRDSDNDGVDDHLDTEPFDAKRR